MVTFYRGYCGYCSIEATDERVLKKYVEKQNKIIKCLHCGGETKLEPAYKGSVFMKQVRCNNVDRRY